MRTTLKGKLILCRIQARIDWEEVTISIRWFSHYNQIFFRNIAIRNINTIREFLSYKSSIADTKEEQDGYLFIFERSIRCEFKSTTSGIMKVVVNSRVSQPINKDDWLRSGMTISNWFRQGICIPILWLQFSRIVIFNQD